MTMEDLSRLVGPFPVTSQSAGNTTSDNTAAMTALGSASEGAPEPQPWTGLDLGAPRPASVMHAGNAGPASAGPWTDAHAINGHPAWHQAADQASPGGGTAAQSGKWVQT